jgi:hypothetical protein
MIAFRVKQSIVATSNKIIQIDHWRGGEDYENANKANLHRNKYYKQSESSSIYVCYC